MIKQFLPAMLLLAALNGAAQQQRAPAYPLITHNPYFSIWSTTDALNESATTHWTGAPHSLNGILMVDGKMFNFLGKPETGYETVLPDGTDKPYEVAFTETKPAENWFQPEFNDKNWKKGKAPFSDNEKEAATIWRSDDLWYRRTFNWKETTDAKHFLKLHHDDNVMVYLNGTPIYEKVGWVDRAEYFDLDKAIRQHIRKGKNVLAIHVRNTAGGRYLDVGISREKTTEWAKNLQQARQVSVKVNPLQTRYSFQCGDVLLDLDFTSPLLPQNLEMVARPVSYITYAVRSKSGTPHKTKIYFSASTDLAVDDPAQQITSSKGSTQECVFLKTGTTEQPVLKKKGDNVRIDWGYFYLAANKKDNPVQYVAPGANQALTALMKGKPFQGDGSSGKSMLMVTESDLGNVGADKKESYVMLGYDEVWSIQYFGQNLRPWWNKSGDKKFGDILNMAANAYDTLIPAVQQFDAQLVKDAAQSGGNKYAEMCALAFRQSISAHTLVESPQKEILFLSKENYSNGSINTVDVTYPSAPLYLIYNPELMKGMLNGIFHYSESGRWKKPFPAHDLGTYPIANGQTYGEDMPVEEAGNMIILTAAICDVERSGEYARGHWKTLTTWAQYLEKEGLDPANQLCTDDFAGHLARNANLSVKAIVALGSFGRIAELMDKKEEASKYKELSRKLAREWMRLAGAGDHYALTFDDKNTWSQKYNLIWDKVLDLDIFPQEVYDTELAYYHTKDNKYGLPLDNRRDYTKSDWILWTAALSDNDAEFKTFIDPVYTFIKETPERVPLSDWHETKTGHKVGFQARSVVGGYFMKMLKDQMQPREKTAFQVAEGWDEAFDVRSDVAIVYGINDAGGNFEERVNSWREKGYQVHFMTGIAWGQYKDYFKGQYDGKEHFDEGQVNKEGQIKWHGEDVPYIVPSSNFLTYLKTHVKRAIDAGVTAIHLEEPEFWAASGYSNAFKREWKSYYGTEWMAQHTSPNATYLSSKLKHHLYENALREMFSYIKQYSRETGKNVRCYVPTHSLVNYSSWGIVSPEASLASLDNMDGYIAQVWTGTSREPVFYNGQAKERVFENAFLEYGSMVSMTAPTGKKVFFLTDPIEDRRKDWEDYRKNYLATFTAQLLYPGVADYEVMPWPNRIYKGRFKTSANGEPQGIPEDFATRMQVMVNALNHVPVSSNQLNGTHGIGVLISNTMMFQRFPTHSGYNDPQLSNFYGMAMPLLKRGIPVETVHLENLGITDALANIKVLVMSYANMKPMKAAFHKAIADWVKEGGVLAYYGSDKDPFQKVTEWWNTGENKYSTASAHLFQLMNTDPRKENRFQSYGNGFVFVNHTDPKEIVMKPGNDEVFMKNIRMAYEGYAKAGEMELKNHFLLKRGPYTIASVMEESENEQPLVIDGPVIDLFDPALPVLAVKEVQPGNQTFLYNIEETAQPAVLASAARIYNESREEGTYSFTAQSPSFTRNVMRVALPSAPRKIFVQLQNKEINMEEPQWHASSKTLLLQFPNHAEGVDVSISY